MVSKKEFQGWILDYACYHRIFPIIHAISIHNSGHLEDLPVPHLRLACATINFIIESEQLSQFDVAIELVQQIHQAVPSSVVCQKTYLRLLTGLKIKALFQTLQEDPGIALVRLNTYFPRTTTKSRNPNEGPTLSKFNQSYKNFRCFFFSLVSNDNQLRAYLREDYNAEFGPKFMESIKKLCGRFLQQIESQLLPPMIEKVLACAECEKFSQISPATEILLDFVQEKKNSSQSKMTNQEGNPAQQSGHRASHVFTQQELFEMLTVFCPIYTQDRLACDHGLNLSSQDLFDSSDSQESLHQQSLQNKSPSAIISNSVELHSHPVVLSAEAQEQPIREQRRPESQPQIDYLHQQQQQQPETVDSFLVLQEKTPIIQVKVSDECSPIILSQSTPAEHPLESAKLRGEDQLSLMETEVAIPQCKNFEDEMEPAQSPLNSNNQPLILQDALRLSQTHLEESYLLQVASQNEVPLEQEAAEKNFLAHSEISERTLERSDPNEKMSSDEQQNKSCEQESSPQIKPFQMTHVSSPLPEKDHPQPNITSTPISCEPTRQQENDKSRETCHLSLFTSPDPLSSQESFLDQSAYIQSWPKQPSYKLLQSKVFRSCNVYDQQYPVSKIEITKKESDPSTTRIQLPETNSPKHSLILSKEDLAPSSCPQTDKDFDVFPNSYATMSSLSLSTDLSSISSGSCDIVTPSDTNSAELFFMSTPEDTIDRDYNFINKHLIQGINACIIKLYRNQQLDVVEDDHVYTIYI